MIFKVPSNTNHSVIHSSVISLATSVWNFVASQGASLVLAYIFFPEDQPPIHFGGNTTLRLEGILLPARKKPYRVLQQRLSASLQEPSRARSAAGNVREPRSGAARPRERSRGRACAPPALRRRGGGGSTSLCFSILFLLSFIFFLSFFFFFFSSLFIFLILISLFTGAQDFSPEQ